MNHSAHRKVIHPTCPICDPALTTSSSSPSGTWPPSSTQAKTSRPPSPPLVYDARRLLDERYAPDGYNIGLNIGATAGQSVMHLHVIPRYQGDMEDPKGGVRGVIPGRRY